jgi:tRNA A37 N6-isopentenylltransferase MiaA
MQIEEGFILRQLLGETVAVPSGEAARKLSGLISMNETGAFLFQLLQTEQTESSLINALMAEYEVDRETAYSDVSAFLKCMRENGLLREVKEAVE